MPKVTSHADDFNVPATEGLVVIWFEENLEEIADDELRDRAEDALIEADTITEAFGEFVDCITIIADVSTGELACQIWFHDDNVLTVPVEHEASILESIACAVLTSRIDTLLRPAVKVAN